MKKRILKIWAYMIVVCLVLQEPVSVRAAEENHDSYGDYVVNIYNERNGLPTGEANVVIQTADGYIWIGSYGGLIRYDGTVFRNYSEEKMGISSSSVRSLFEDSRGRLWIGTNDAGVFVYEKEQFTKIEGPEDRSFLCIRDFTEGKDGVIYAASNSGLAKIEEGALTPIRDDKVMNNTIYSLALDNLGRVWCCLSWGCVVVEQDLAAGELPSETFFTEKGIYCLAEGNQGEIYLGTSGTEMAKLICLDKGFNKDSFEVEYYDTGDVTTHNQIRTCKDGSILISGLKGFGWFRPDGSFYEFGEDKKASSVNAATLDYEGNIWLASTALGVVKYSKGCFETPNDKTGLGEKALNVILKQGDKYYVGTDNGLFMYDKNWKPIQNSLTELLADDRIRHMTSANEQVWIASYYENGVICYDPATEEIVSYNMEEGLINSGVRMLLPLSDGSVAVGTQGGISIIKDGQVVKSYGREEGLANTTILCMVQDKDGCLYAGSDGGGIYAISGTEVKNYGFEEGLNEGVVLRMLPNQDGSGYFVSAGSSLYYWEEESFRKLENFEKSSGSIFDFYERGGSLWMMQNNGILAVDKQELLSGEEAETRLYGFSFGLTGSLNANTWNYLDEDGTIYLSTRSGISTFQFTSVQNPLPKGIINEVIVDDVVYSHPESLTLNKNAKRITIDFATLSYTGTTVSSMSYRLQGFDEQETVIRDEKSSSISYTNLPGGDYIFHLKIFNSADGKENHEYQISIHKEKQLREYPLFWILLAAVILAALAALGYLYAHTKIKRIKKRQEEYQDITNQFLKAFAKLIDAKDKYTNGHSIRVAYYSRELARRLQMSEDEQEKVYYIALMHDIGKIGIPDSILKKEGRLTDEEMDVIRTHPKIGGEILKECTAFPGIAEGASYHHERYDGKGYCMKLKGEEIPLVARIIGVADAYDAMSNARCYRKALDREVIINELKEGAGTQFDEKIVPIMLQMIEEGSVPIDIQENKIEN